MTLRAGSGVAFIATIVLTTPAYADLGDQLFKLLADDGAANDHFGGTVAISGTTAIVGAYFDDDNGTDSGSACLFNTTTGQQIAKLLPDHGAAEDLFGRSVAISGTTAIVGAFQDDDDGTDSGSAYLFDTTTGQQFAKLLPDDGTANNLFGWSIAISGTTAIVGAWRDVDDGTDSGSAYLFDTTTGQQITKLLPNDGGPNDEFGDSVSISGTTAIVGAPYDNVGCPEDPSCWPGSAYLIDVTTGQQFYKLTAADGAHLDQFGISVAISGTTAIGGAILGADNGTVSGSAYLFDAAGASTCPADLDGDGTVGPADLAILLGNWGPCE